MSINEQPRAISTRAQVASEVRALLAKNRIAVARLPELTGRQSQSYWTRRIQRGDVALDVDDLGALAAVLGVEITQFFGAPPSGRGPSGSRSRLPTGPYAGQLVLLPNFEDLHQESIAQPDAA